MHTVSVLSQFNNNHNKQHWGAARMVLRYLKGTAGHGLTYSKHGSDFTAFSDADWANCEIDRRSYTGYVVMLSGGAISWGSRKQRSVALSSTEAEYVALVETTKQAIFLHSLKSEMMKEKPTAIIVGCDNQSTMFNCGQEGPSKKMRHIDIRHHYLRELIERGHLELNYVPTEVMVADVLTKALGKEKHLFFTSKMGVNSV